MSTSASGSTGGPVTLDQFIALNEELTALVRAGVPLERGLVEAGRDLRGRLGALAGELGDRMGGGMTLPEALEAAGGNLPTVYRAVVEAGVRSGRLSEALERMTGIARNYAEARSALGLALLYPLILLSLAYGLGVALVVLMVPRFLAAFRSLGLPAVPGLELLERAGESAVYWAPIPPLLALLLVFRWAWTGRAGIMDGGGLGRILDRIPGVGSMTRSFRSANFAELLALLIDHQVPLDEAVRLAGEASGDRDFRASADRFADSIRRGDGPEAGRPIEPGAFPPLLAWMLTAGHRQGDLPAALGQLALTYRRRATSRAEILRLVLPFLCMLVLGVGAVMSYALLLFVPLAKLWTEMAQATNR